MKRVNLKKTVTVDSGTGEVLLDETQFYTVQESEPSFIKFYLQDVGRLTKVQPKTMAVLLELLKKVGYDNRIVVSYGVKKELSAHLGISVKGVPAPNVIDQHLHKLCKAGLLVKAETGIYLANPVYFGKGKWQDLRQIKIEFTYGPDGKVINAQIKKAIIN